MNRKLKRAALRPKKQSKLDAKTNAKKFRKTMKKRSELGIVTWCKQ